MVTVCSLDSMFNMIRIGFAKDIHKLVPDRDLILGGVKIPYHLGLLGHSDADVVLHAVSEAILGALSLGDLGTHFPDNDIKYKNIDSSIILKEVLSMMKKEGYVVSNVDISVALEKPKLKDYILSIKNNISLLMNLKNSQVSFKAMTNEGLGAVGKNEACEAYAVVLLVKE